MDKYVVANKIMGKYQRPCAILTRREREVEITFKNASYIDTTPRKYDCYEGSARGCDKADISNFKDICEETGLIQYVAGHQGAFGLGILPEDVPFFLEATDRALHNMASEPVHYVDYIYRNTNIDPNQILEIAELDGIWGKDIEPSIVAIQDLKVTSDMVTIYKKSSNTIKITLPNKVSLMIFKAADNICEKFEDIKGYLKLDCIGEPHKNEWMGWVTPQIHIEDFDIVAYSNFDF